MTEEEQPRAMAGRLDITFYIHGPFLHVLDGGKRGRSWGAPWSSDGTSSSYRPASEEEIEMWGLLKTA